MLTVDEQKRIFKAYWARTAKELDLGVSLFAGIMGFVFGLSILAGLAYYYGRMS